MWQCRASYLVEHLGVYGIFVIFLSSGRSLIGEILRLANLERDPVNGIATGSHATRVFYYFGKTPGLGIRGAGRSLSRIEST